MTVVIYSDTHCNRCKGIERILIGRGIEFDKVIISEMEEAARLRLITRAKAFGSLALPLLEVDGKFVTLNELIA
ncbi:glutaredoxin domain-containing protein [Bacteroides sp.]|uniref:glutaredoxin domain-containing protein n=1 Tax=Bacteroides sp. TaxID=29523 RepID=UPI002629AF60|nr:glutaredoxin domain-containing protein [Bacteroides sp.]MDD3040541.1 glutaredoxin domain-containing protein [Bacteroides sp.]